MPDLQKTLERHLLVTKRQQQWDAADVTQPFKFFLQCCKPGAGRVVVDTFAVFIECIGAPLENRIVHELHTSERLRQQWGLFGYGIEASFEGGFRFNAYKYRL